MTWRAASPGQFYDAGETTVVYFDSASGDTHLLSDFAAHLLGLIAREPMDFDRLVHRVESEVDEPAPGALAASVEKVLRELVSLDVVARD